MKHAFPGHYVGAESAAAELPAVHKLDARELAMVLAGLRLAQRYRDFNRDFWEVSTDGGKIEALSNVEIDNLCERLNR